jgi:hypothetical protein
MNLPLLKVLISGYESKYIDDVLSYWFFMVPHDLKLL